MENYKPDEKLLVYHLDYYFRLLDVKRKTEENLDQIKETGKKLINQLQEIPPEILDFDLERVYEVTKKATNELDSSLERIAENINNKWNEIKLYEDWYLESYFFKWYPVKYILPIEEWNFDKLKDISLKFKQEFELSKSNMHKISLPNLIIVKFDSIDKAIKTTKEFLVKYSKK